MSGLLTTVKDQIGDARRRASTIGDWLSAVPEAHDLPPDAVAFLDPIDQICSEPPPRYARATIVSITALIISLLMIGSLIKVDVLVTAGGRLVTSAPPVLLQPIERAIIREISVHAGELVHKGQVLATLDPTFARADFGSLSAQESNLRAQDRRLQAELEGHNFVVSSGANDDDKLQQTLFQQRQASYQSRLRQYEEEIQRLTATITATEHDATLLAGQLSLARDVEEMRGSLMKSQNGSRLNFLESQSTRMRFERDYQNSTSQLVELKHQVLSKQAELQGFIDDWRRQILESQSAVKTQLAAIGGNLSKASLINDLVVVSSPVDGVILDVAQRSVGSILHEAEPLITIIPEGSQLVADVGIASGDVGSVKAGDEVLMKIDAFPYSRHGLLMGHLSFISEEAMTSNSLSTGSSQSNMASAMGVADFHRAEIALSSTEMKNMPEGARLLPGMTLRAEIKVGERSVLGFFLAPMTKGLTEAMREK